LRMPSDRSQIRAFLSSTFSDFQEERDLLAKQVFPTLRQKAKGHGVEVVDVDLRWGITEEQSQQGQTLPICLAEIENCRPYFIGLLGERYGWVPEPDKYSPELLERQGWLREHQGGASVTELEILHGVLNNPDMAGRALFYFRDPAYSTARAEAGEPGWRSEGEQERQKLESLKQRIRVSGFPVVEGLADPQAIAERIEADLWRLIEQQFPEGEPPDALAIEAARHASYRADRTGLYLGGESYIHQLEQWIDAGEQRLLITGESGSGKSALIANWMVAHQRSHPEDVVFAHHLGCSSDANAVRPLLARLIDTASQLIEEDIKVPQDWWELVAKVGETLAYLSAWCRRNGLRWIWVLDGLDKLSAEDQQALPWLPTTLPPGIQVVATALACPARSILEGRDYRSLVIGPLQRQEQAALIDRYLRIFARQLETGLKERLLAHPLAGSPLFLRVLLEELRLCGRFETLGQQLEHYLGAESIDDLYERVLARLESDGHGTAVQKALTALWASRAGLTESELLVITGLPPAAWAPIAIGLQEALVESNGRLVFSHDYLRFAVQDRYLPTEEERRQAHSDLADWFEGREGWDERTSEELPWQLQQARRLEDLRDLLLSVPRLAQLVADRDSSEVLSYWREARDPSAGEIDEMIAEDMEKEIDKRRENPDDLIWIIDQIDVLLDEAGLCRELLVRLRELSLEIVEHSEKRSLEAILSDLQWLARAYYEMSDSSKAAKLLERCIELCRDSSIDQGKWLASSLNLLAQVSHRAGDFEEARNNYERAILLVECALDVERPNVLCLKRSLAILYADMGLYPQAEQLMLECLETSRRLLGATHCETIGSELALGQLYCHIERFAEAEALFDHCYQARCSSLGPQHPDAVSVLNELAMAIEAKGEVDRAASLYRSCLSCLEGLYGFDNVSALAAAYNLAELLHGKGDYEQAEMLYLRCLASYERLLGPQHRSTINTTYFLAELYSCQDRRYEAIPLRRRELAWCREQDGDLAGGTLTSIYKLAVDLREIGELEEAEGLFRELIDSSMEGLEKNGSQIGYYLGSLVETLEKTGKTEEAIVYIQRFLDYLSKSDAIDSRTATGKCIDLVRTLHKTGQQREALLVLESLEKLLLQQKDQAEYDAGIVLVVADLRAEIEGSM